MKELTKGALIRLRNGKTCKVKKEIGRGGQGIVYTVDYGGKEHALKWYHVPEIISSGAFYKNLERNATASPPAANFLWPLAVTERQEGSFGYVMDIRPEGYHEMGKFILGQVAFRSVRALINACLQICEAFQRLHILGLSYQDMNDGNFFINPETGRVLICDNDNVAPDGTSTGILGKVGYMAPEIVEGKAMPNRYTDYYSLAVCLFILIYMNRPFDGARFIKCPCTNNPEMARRLYGFSSVFIMDPHNAGNRPVKGVHNNVIRRWTMFPALLAEAFQKTFSHEAIMDQTRRLMDRQWIDILMQARSMLVRCPECGQETFAGTARPQETCVCCGKTFGRYPVLRIGGFTIPLLEGQPIYGCLADRNEDCEAVSGEVVSKNGRLGIINRSRSTWTVILPDGSIRTVESGKGMPVRPGFRITLGRQGMEAVIA